MNRYMPYSNDNDLTLANEYIINKDYSKAFYIYSKLVDQNNDEAMNKLGICYENEYGFNADWKRAFDWYKKASDLGNVYAIYNLANLYINCNNWALLNSNEVKRENIDVIYYLEYAAYNNVKDDMKLLAQRFDKISEWQCEHDNNEEYDLGCCYSYAKYVSQNYEVAFNCF